ncbi:MAG: YidB family protein [Burkholderiales bacterium]
MGLFDTITSQIAGKLSQGEHGGLLDGVISLINHPDTGGLAGLVQNFKDQGLGEIVSSWVGTGKNLPISAGQLQQALGNEQIQQLAGKLGVNTNELSAKLAEFLPQVVDHLTPDGSVPESGLAEQGMNLLKKKLLGG